MSVEVSKNNNMLDYTCWDCIIYGREGTIWEGGEFIGQLSFPSGYPTEPPVYVWKGLESGKFKHMNVYGSGRTCLDVINKNEQYRPTRTVLEILQALEDLLYNPNPQSPTDATQAKLYVSNRGEYDATVRQYVKQYMKEMYNK